MYIYIYIYIHTHKHGNTQVYRNVCRKKESKYRQKKKYRNI